MLRRFKHSGAFGDLIYGLALVQHLRGGEFYLHLNQINWIGRHYYGSDPSPFHQGRLNQEDYESLRPLLLDQPYISHVGIMDNTVEITHNLDRFRPAFVNHPGNYIDIYSDCFGITDAIERASIRNSPWLTVRNPKTVEGRPICINRTLRWLPPQLSDQWHTWREQGWADKSFFLGLPEEYEAFVTATKFDQTVYIPTSTMLDMAEYIAGAQTYIGNQSAGLALAIGLGRTFHCEYRRDLPFERNECVFLQHPRGIYF